MVSYFGWDYAPYNLPRKEFRYFRLINFEVQSGLLNFAEINLSSDPAADGSMAGAVATASRNLSGYEPAKAIDGNLATGWLPAGGAVQPSDYFQIVLPAARTVRRIRIGAFNDGASFAHTVRGFTFVGSEDGATWEQLGAATGMTGWTNGQQRVILL